MDTPNETAESQWMSSKPDDLALVKAIVPQWRETLGYLYREWVMYEGGCWNIRAHEQIQVVLQDVLDDLRSQHRLEMQINQGRIESIAKMMQTRLFISDQEFNAMLPEQERYINLQNGLYSLDDFALEAHDPALRFTTQLDFEYDPSARCPNWDNYLRTSLLTPDGKVDLELIFLLQEAMAYSMTARTDMKASFWCVGKPDSGKSTLIALIHSLMGTLHGTINLNNLGEDRFMLAQIVGKRVVTFTEAEESTMIPDALYKAMVGGVDEIYTDVKNKPGISFKPIAKFWWAMNEAPRMKDRSGAMLNRLKPIPFEHSIAPDRRIGNLHQLLVRERPGIFNWLMVGYQRLLDQEAFTVSEQSERWKENYRTQNDTEAGFLTEWLIPDEEARIKSSLLYSQYAAWCRESGFKAKNIHSVAKDWLRLGLRPVRANDGMYWHGYRLHTINLK